MFVCDLIKMPPPHQKKKNYKNKSKLSVIASLLNMYNQRCKENEELDRKIYIITKYDHIIKTVYRVASNLPVDGEW